MRLHSLLAASVLWTKRLCRQQPASILLLLTHIITLVAARLPLPSRLIYKHASQGQSPAVFVCLLRQVRAHLAGNIDCIVALGHGAADPPEVAAAVLARAMQLVDEFKRSTQSLAAICKHMVGACGSPPFSQTREPLSAYWGVRDLGGAKAQCGRLLSADPDLPWPHYVC